ncbi:MAG: cobalamin biosynthesis protein [Hyphomicrobiales bacterium]|nr:cobalamin biosynthesis protein [Hyphomicrobiales bacterium]
MRPPFAIGIGCRKGCTGESIASLVRRALALAAPPEKAAFETRALREAVIFSSELKGEELGLAEAAAILGMRLVLLPRVELLAAAPRCATRSARVEAIIGLPSLAEAAALAGAGAGSRLVVERISEGGASCALAIPAESAS